MTRLMPDGAARAAASLVSETPANPDAEGDPAASTDEAQRAASVAGARRLPVGAEVVPGHGAHFRVWAPRCERVAVVIEADERESSRSLQTEGDGYFSGFVPHASAGTRYRLQLDDDPNLYADPATRFQPQGPHGPSEVVDPARFQWTDGRWAGVEPNRRVLYELHVGTFTREGTWAAATRELPELARLGITLIEVMPVADFPGRYGWGYDGVNIFAPCRLYGNPDDFRRFVDAAHAEGIGVILDVVYNHLGPSGCQLSAFSDYYFSDRYKNEWGDPINFDGENAAPVREFFIANARYWIEEFHLDGLRLDATQQMFDDSPEHIIAAITREVTQSAPGRIVFVVCENEPQDVRLLRGAAEGGYGASALWNDDFHHTAKVALTGRNEAYYSDYRGRAQELVSAVKWGFLYQGQRCRWQKKRRGTPAFDVPPTAFVHFLENHDQIANTASGGRLHQSTSPGRYRAMTALLLLAPQTPMLFQGQEFASSSPFLFFADHAGKLADDVRKGRTDFLAQFPSIDTPDGRALLADPGAPDTFERCKLDLSERESHAEAYALHLDLLTLRRSDAVFCRPRQRGVDGAILDDQAFVLRFFGEDAGDRLIIVNLGTAFMLDILPEPLLAAPADFTWHVAWSSDAARYGGKGAPPLEVGGGWRIPGEAALVLVAHPEPADR